MKAKVFVLTFLCNLFLLTQATISNENTTILDGTASNYTTKHVVGGRPIVIHTQIQHYDQPTLKEYQECHDNLYKCKKVCEGVEDPVVCVKECPVCPFLVKEKIVVQGINDTDFTPMSATPLNTTNIIRLTNQIRNVIESHQGNITYRNENIVHVHQNISRVGGKYGLGYNNTDPCCIIVRSSKNCEIKPFSTATRCHHKRHRVCGKQCKSRVMMAKRVTLCENADPFDANEDYSEDNCRETVKYVPYQSRWKHNVRSRNKCSYVPSWPYVVCGQNGNSYEHSICKRCQRLTYFYILQRGIPAQCSRCFMAYSRPNFEMNPPSWYPLMGPHIVDNDFEFEDDLDLNQGGWRQDKTKCRLPNGIISENCNDFEGSGTDAPPTTTDSWAHLPEAQDEYMEYDNFDDIDFEETPRRRRHTFTRSKYSRRYRQ
ncbi:uncharacterized protein LOC135949154 [Calliphora vicina]|uniref:uncharacterized protein LOC135949154 n=1 Tax=Calliphora vicina TaxID=7373 RepID=UPI00325ADC2C